MNRRGKTKEGFLHVKQSSRFGKAWKRKWVVIRPNATSAAKGADQGGSILLELYLEKGAYNKTVTSLLLEGVTSIRRVLSKSQPRAFEFMKGDTNVALTLAAESETDAQEWMEIFKKLLLPASEQKELKSIEGYGFDVMRLCVVPSKDSQRLKLSGVYLAGVSRLQVALHHVVTGEKVLEWDLRHIKRFMLPSKGPQQDLEKIACLQISNRSPQGQGEYLFYSTQAKPFVEAIYERLSSAITVKERRSRTSSVLFEIPPKELEQLAKAIQEGGDPSFVMVGSDGSEEGNVFGDSVEIIEEEVKEGSKTNGDVKPSNNGDASAETKEVKESVGNGISASSNEKSENEQKEEEKVLGTNGVTVTTEGDATANVGDNGVKVAKDKNGDSAATDGEKDVDETATDNKVETSDVDVSQENSKEDSKTDTNAESDNLSNENDTSTAETRNEHLNDSLPSPVETLETTGDQDQEKHDVATGPIDGDDEQDELTGDVSEVTPRMPPAPEEIEKDIEGPVESKSEDDNADEKNSSTCEVGEPVSNEVNPEAVSEAKTTSENGVEVDVSNGVSESDQEGVSVAPTDEGNTSEQSEEAPIVTRAATDVSKLAGAPTEITESMEPEIKRDVVETPDARSTKDIMEMLEAESTPDSANSESTPELAKSDSTQESKEAESAPDYAESEATPEESSTVQAANLSSQQSQDTEHNIPAASADSPPSGNTDEPSSVQSPDAAVNEESALTESTDEPSSAQSTDAAVKEESALTESTDEPSSAQSTDAAVKEVSALTESTDEPSSAQSPDAAVKEESALTESTEEASPAPDNGDAAHAAQDGVTSPDVEGQVEDDTRF